MGIEIDLLKNYPKTVRDVKSKGVEKTAEDRLIARTFGKDFFDGDRKHGYGGYNYHPRFWQPVIPTFQDHFGFSLKTSILDVGCGKGFMLYDISELIPGIKIKGIDISEYAIENAMEEMKPHVQVANALDLPFEDNSFDVVISINTIHNLARDECGMALKEIQRVSKEGSFVTIDAYNNLEEKELMEAWNLTAKTMMHVDEWKLFFKEVSYDGDYYWFIP